jgi:hypothetical protein
VLIPAIIEKLAVRLDSAEYLESAFVFILLIENKRPRHRSSQISNVIHCQTLYQAGRHTNATIILIYQGVKNKTLRPYF